MDWLSTIAQVRDSAVEYYYSVYGLAEHCCLGFGLVEHLCLSSKLIEHCCSGFGLVEHYCSRSLLGWRKGVCQKKTETRRKIIGGSRKAYRERCSGILLKFARRFAEGIGKLTGTTPGDHRKKTR
ncbi:hypothetical protein GW17_00031723 [Ensete ventricosum]|nr:hypothetical protein GW17_00031723 [Ensete ventricosum]